MTIYDPKNISKDNTSFIQTFNHFNKWLKKIIIIMIMLAVFTTDFSKFTSIYTDIMTIIKSAKPLSLFSVSNSIEHPSETTSIKKSVGLHN